MEPKQKFAHIVKDATGNILVSKDGYVTCISEGMKIIYIHI